jgi:transcription elongation factor GreA
MQEAVITREGLERLNKELDRLAGDGRLAIAERLSRAVASEANHAENGDLFQVREDQALLEQRIAWLQEKVRDARVVEPQLGNGRIDVGERVRVLNVDTGERLDLELVGPLEADPAAGRISVASPLGTAVAGRRRGELVDVDAPRGTLRYKILRVEAPLPARAR